MDRMFATLTGVCLLFCCCFGCETASRVADKADPPTPVAPAIQQVSNSEPGPEDPDAPDEFTSTKSGLKYRILRKGTGQKPTSASTVTAHYKGWLDNDTVFDSSYKRGEPASFPLLNVVPGWTEGLQYVREGGMIELEIPGNLGYGASGSPPKIPPNATLHFIVELLEVE
ncbi:MAG: FKBP-type peptidyl-prolyl cis-trans isomerase [Planctomycetaceae bacterium]